MEISNLLNRQLELKGQIDKLISNYKKDSADRKTQDYYTERLRRLHVLADEFHRNHKKIIVQDDIPDEHEYFEEEVFANIQKKISDYTKIFESAGLELVQIDGDGAKATDPVGLSAEIQKVLRNQKALIKALTRNIDEIIAQKDFQHPASYYQIKLAILEKHMLDLTKNNATLWDSTTADNILDYTPDVYYKMEAKLESVIIDLQQHTSVSTPDQSREQKVVQSENDALPKITMPTFSGNYMDWVNFKDLYLEIVNNARISDTRKMHYLSQALSGEAKMLIKHLPAVGSNYEVAWTILTNRYDNKRLLVATLVDKLLTQSTIKIETQAALKSLHDVTQECIYGLKAQDVPVGYWDAILTHILLKKLDPGTQKAFEQSLENNRRLITIEELLQFLERRFQSLEVRGKAETTHKTCAAAITSEQNCKVCKTEAHPLYRCNKFEQASCSEKWRWVMQLQLCANCLRPGHKPENCRLQHCTKCEKKHNTLLHQNKSSNQNKSGYKPRQDISQKEPQKAHHSNSEKESSSKGSQKVSLVANNHDSDEKYVLLGSAMVQLVANNGQLIECRALLDSCSQINLITKRLMNKLGGVVRSMPTNVEGIGLVGKNLHHRTTIELRSKHSNFATSLNVHVIPKIVSDQPSHRLTTSDWAIPEHITLADQNFAHPGRIDLLIGAELYLDLLTDGKLKLADNIPRLQNTVFGWIVAGTVFSPHQNTVTCGVCTVEELETTISKFWELEDTPSCNNTLTDEELKCESHFVQHTRRSADNRFIVKLPLKEHPSALGKSKAMAFSRFLALERRLGQNIELKSQYTQFMDEYRSLGHMSEINIEDTISQPYFIPHHCILRPESTSTKLRVVFDASAKASNGVSLNELMFNGPNVQSELFSILLRFRIHKYVLKTDVEKMYRQIWVDPEDRKLQVIMWRSSPSEKLKYYELNTVTYGTRAAPYLATRCLKQLADEQQNKFPMGSTSLRSDFYVDDGLIGANSIREALDIQDQLIQILNMAGMKLRKWCANNPKLLHGIAPEDQEVNLNFNSDEQQSTKTLGLLWLPKSDCFCIRANIQKRTRTTKRSMTSDLARIFDPLGLIAPVVVTAKMQIQQLWQLKIDWDAELPSEVERQWSKFQDGLTALDNLKIQRHVFSEHGQRNIQLHVFADASEKAYGAAVYLRSVQKDNTIKVNLLCSKSRVAPIKPQTIPRLELCAALLAAELMSRVKQDLNYQDKAAFYWSDSEIVLSWINNHPGTLPAFVAHRIIKITQRSNPEQWRHVPSKQNPADILSRGLKARELQTCNMWFYGPLLLYQVQSAWPTPFKRELCIERESPIVALCKESSESSKVSKDQCWIYSINTKNKFEHIKRVVGYVLRFVKHTKELKGARQRGIELSPLELDAALKVVVREIQANNFQDLKKMLLKEKRVPKAHSLSSLSPFIDEEGIIRVGGRLELSSQGYDAKHQMILPTSDVIVKLIADKIHKENYHCGPLALLAQIKQQFWPVGGKNLARSIVQHCVRCTRSKPILYKQIMGNLPSLRVEPARPFIHCGVDYCGPFKVHFKTRGKPPQKAYIAVFCCFSTKAVHLELVTDLTTDAFIGALKRFISRRGHCKTIFCDNATNFVGARNQLDELAKAIHSPPASDSIIRVCSNKGIDFRFIPPRSPHFGGLWEAAVKSAKKLLVPRLGEASMTFEELNTVTIEIEAILNSRPITPMSSDPNDLTALTPGHFLIGEPLTTNVDAHTKPSMANLSARWQEVSKLKHSFWQRWSTEYLSELQQRHKWKGPMTTIEPNTMVILKDDCRPVLQWPLGRITKIYKGDDGAVRVCDVKTMDGLRQRPIHKLAPLFPEDDSPEKMHDSITETAEKPSGSRSSLLVSIPLSRLKKPYPTPQEDTPRKLQRIQPGFLLAIITLFLLPLALCSPINITRFSPKPGIYFEQLSTVKLATNSWNIIVYYDLGPYRNELDILSNGTSTLQRLCNMSANETMCSFLVGYFEQVKEGLEEDLKMLSVKRAKRGAVDIVGNIANSLFGVLDSNYAAQISAIINGLHKDDEHLERLLKNQTSLIDSTINVFKASRLDIQKRFDEIDEQINNLIHGSSSGELNNKILILSLSVQMFIMVSNLQRTHASIMDVLIDSHHGKINPLLLTPNQVADEIMKVKAHLPPDWQLPIHQNNILELYKLIKVHGVLAKGHVVFTIEVPLADSRQFQLLHLVPMVASVNGTLSSVQLSTKYLAINPHHDSFVSFTKSQLDSCWLLSERELLCFNMQATYHKSAEVNKCELDLLTNAVNPRCELYVLNDTTVWYQLDKLNQWIYATAETIQLNAVCGNEELQITLEDSGLLEFQSDCNIRNEVISIQGHQKVVTSMHVSSSQIEMPRGWTRQYLTTLPTRKPFELSVGGLESIQQQLALIKMSALPHAADVTNAHSLIVSYTNMGVVIVLVIMVILVALKIKQQWVSRPSPPIPLPRRMSQDTIV